MLNQNFSKRLVQRGMLFWLDIDKYVAKERTHVNKKVRPIIILQNNMGNKNSPTAIGAIVTSSMTKARLPVHVEIGKESGLSKPSVVLLEQLITFDQEDLGDYIGTVPFDKMTDIDVAFAISGGIQINKKEVEKEVFNIQVANEMLNTLKETEDMLKLVDNQYFRTVKSLAISQLKGYCEKCGVNYNNFIKKDQRLYLNGMGDVMSVQSG